MLAPPSDHGSPPDIPPDAYTVERELGRGGMATVYVARDKKHGRRVALKVLRTELAASLGAERFRREIALVANLQHPHIVPVHDSGETASGMLWFTMPLIEGESLRARLIRETQLPLGEALRIAREVSEALDYAHQQGILHRDIKPENILLSRGHALVADFGVARAIGASGSGAGAEGPTLTGTGIALGTPAYMSPEQATGERTVDARTDIYALGCVLFEMLAGEPPYTAATAQGLLAKRLSGDIPSVRRVRSAVPASVDAIIAKSLAPVAADRYATAAGLATALEGATAAPPTRPTRTRDRMTGGFALLGLGICIGAGVLFAWRHRASAPTAVSTDSTVGVAVLPFDAGGDTANAYFADGIADAIREKLSALPRLEVIARTSSDPYRHSEKPTEQIGRELGVQYLLTGRVQWERLPSGTRRVRVSPALVQVAAGRAPVTKWEQSYDTTLADVFDVQSAVATQVADRLGVALSPSAATQLAERPTKNLAAYDAYLRSMALRNEDPPTIRRALAEAEQAVALDSGFAEAWARVSILHAFLYGNTVPVQADADAARQAADRAIALAPASATGYRARGFYYLAATDDLAAARTAYETAAKLDPSSSSAITHLSFFKEVAGRWAEALSDLRRAAVLDPRSVGVADEMSRTLLGIRHYPEARREADRALALEPGDLYAAQLRAQSWVGEGDLVRARASLRDLPPTLDRATVVAYVTSWGFGAWVLDSADRALVLRLPPAAFDNDRARWGGARAEIYWLAGDTVHAREFADTALAAADAQLREAPFDPDLTGHLTRGLALAYLGRTTATRAGERLLAASQARDKLAIPFARYYLAWICVTAGDHSRALDQLDSMLTEPYPISPASLKIDPRWVPLRGDPRFQRMIAQPPVTFPTPPGGQ